MGGQVYGRSTLLTVPSDNPEGGGVGGGLLESREQAVTVTRRGLPNRIFTFHKRNVGATNLDTGPEEHGDGYFSLTFPTLQLCVHASPLRQRPKMSFSESRTGCRMNPKDWPEEEIYFLRHRDRYVVCARCMWSTGRKFSFQEGYRHIHLIFLKLF